MNPNDKNPYSFIFNQNQPAPTGPIGTNKNRQMIIFVAFAAVVLIVVAIAFSVITSSGKPTGAEAISVAAYQTELTRVLALGEKDVRSSVLQQKRTTLLLTLTTDQQKVTSALSTKGITATPAQLAQYQDTTIDTNLTNSLQVDRYDSTFEDIVDALFAEYYKAIRAAENAATTANEKQSFASVRENAETLYNLNGTEPDQVETENSSTFESSDSIQN